MNMNIDILTQYIIIQLRKQMSNISKIEWIFGEIKIINHGFIPSR